jgi:hypothetical protein
MPCNLGIQSCPHLRPVKVPGPWPTTRMPGFCHPEGKTKPIVSCVPREFHHPEHRSDLCCPPVYGIFSKCAIFMQVFPGEQKWRCSYFPLWWWCFWFHDRILFYQIAVYYPFQG